MVVIVDLGIEADEYQKLYEGSAKNVFSYTRDGRSVSFPAHILRAFVSHRGVYGSFVIEFDENNRFVSIEKI